MITIKQREPGGARREGAEVAGELYRKAEVEGHSHASEWVALAMGKNNQSGRYEQQQQQCRLRMSVEYKFVLEVRYVRTYL